VFDNFEDYVKFSPIFRMRNIKIPVLLVVGDQDWPWVQQMIAEYAVLRSEGKNVGLVRYANESHTLRQRRDMEDGLERQIGFFDKFLKPQSPSPAGR
jgi:dipeptidyl aminopeptidase/acylaminoacyl peptidase